MNVATSKSTQKHKPQVTISECNCPMSDTRIYDVSALLWVITWPSGKLRVYVDVMKLYDPKLSSSCFIGPSLTASRHSRGRRDQDQVASINWHPICKLWRSKSSSPTPKQDPTECHDYRWHSQPMLLNRSNTDAHPYDCRCPRCASWDNRWSEDWPTRSLLHTRGGWYPNRTTRHLVFTLMFVLCATTETCLSYSFTTTIVGAKVASVPQWLRHHQWRNEQR